MLAVGIFSTYFFLFKGGKKAPDFSGTFSSFPLSHPHPDFHLLRSNPDHDLLLSFRLSFQGQYHLLFLRGTFTSLTSLEEILTASVTAFLLFCAFTIRTIFVFRPFFKTTLFFFTDSFFTLFCTFTLTTAFTTLPSTFFDCNTREAADPLTAFRSTAISTPESVTFAETDLLPDTVAVTSAGFPAKGAAASARYAISTVLPGAITNDFFPGTIAFVPATSAVVPVLLSPGDIGSPGSCEAGGCGIPVGSTVGSAGFGGVTKGAGGVVGVTLADGFPVGAADAGVVGATLDCGLPEAIGFPVDGVSVAPGSPVAPGFPVDSGLPADPGSPVAPGLPVDPGLSVDSGSSVAFGFPEAAGKAVPPGAALAGAVGDALDVGSGTGVEVYDGSGGSVGTNVGPGVDAGSGVDAGVSVGTDVGCDVGAGLTVGVAAGLWPVTFTVQVILPPITLSAYITAVPAFFATIWTLAPSSIFV